MDKLTAMQCFVQVAEQGGFSAAARALGRSKASVSKHVAELEAMLGAQLLVRTTRQVRVTDTGRAVLDRSRALLADVHELENLVQTSTAALQGTLRVAGPVTFAELYLGPVLHGFSERHPALSVDLTLTDGYVDLVETNVDLAVRIGQLDDSSLVARRLAASRIVCCAAPAYLGAHGTPSAPQELSGHALIIDSNFRQPAHWRFTVGGRVQTVRVPARLRVNSAVLARDLACAGGGIVRIPEFVAGEALADGRLQELPLSCEEQELGIYAVYPQRRHVARRVRVFVDFLVDWFAGGLVRVPG